MKVWRLLAAAIFCAVALPALAAETLAPTAGSQVLAPDSFEARLQSALASSKPGLAGKSYAGEVEDITAATTFYAARNFAPLWVSGTVLSPRALLAVAELGRSDDWGLKATDFTIAESVIKVAKDGAATPGNPVEAELSITRAVLKYARFARGGRIADPGNELSGYIDRKPQILAPLSVLEQLGSAQAADEALRGFHPQHVQFERLRKALLAARADEGRPVALRLPPGPTLAPGQVHPTVAALRTRLAVPAPPATAGLATPELVYDPVLVAAVKDFQAKSGLRADGYVGEKTRVALNGDNKSKIPALIANMEQWRWMPATLGETHVQVNIPEYEMRLVKGGRVVHSERVVTGKVQTATPAFSADMQTIVFQPKWGVPDSIKINELLPRLQDGRGLRAGLRMSLNGRDIDPWNVDWSRADITRYHVYQPSGDDNALGVVKFLFPNKHAVYMHDTPSKNLFNASSRSYSHGCVRVRNPVRLAELVLAGDKNWNSQKVRDLVEDGPEDNAVKLDTKIPVHMTYFTASVDDVGRVSTYPDVYGHERRIMLAIDGRADQIVKLNPPPLEVPRPTATTVADGGKKRRRVEEASVQVSADFDAPSGLGFAPPPKYFKPSGGTSNRFRGNSTNDVIMRALGGF